MPNICAIFPHRRGTTATLTCLAKLLTQSRQPDHIIIISRDAPADPIITQARSMAQQQAPAVSLHILPAPENLPEETTGIAHGFDHAFRQLKADLVWVLTADLQPCSASLETLLAAPVPANTIRVSLLIHTANSPTLSRPLATPANPTKAPTWHHHYRKSDLPAGDLIACRGNLTGALYPREAWQQAGSPEQEQYLAGEDEEYPWRLRQAGFRFATVPGSLIESEAAQPSLLHKAVGGRTYFYQTGQGIPQMYYKLRNWALLERNQRPGCHLQRLAACGGYILYTINAILQSGEMSIRRLYNVFRALHNGYYGKARPY